MLESEEPIAHLSARIRLGALYILQAKFEKAKNQFTKGSKEAKTIGEIEWESGFHSLLAYIHRTTGNNSKALSESTMAFELAIQTDFQYLKRNALYCKGLSLLNKNSFEEASITAERLKKLIETGMHDKRTERYNYHLKGLIELKKNNFSPAINNFNKAISLLPAQNSESWAVYNRHAAFLDSLARAYYLSGNIEKARIEYEKINNLTMGRLMYGDIYARSYYMLGKIYQQTDWKCKAIENYQTFLNLWKDADANIPEIKDAKKQLSLLQPNP
jgi:tetratricopeptide (TPR) repeat protein